jgi:hypothetical protein
MSSRILESYRLPSIISLEPNSPKNTERLREVLAAGQIKHFAELFKSEKLGAPRML